MHVGNAHEDGINLTAQIAGQQAKQDTQRRLQHHGTKANHQRHPGAVKYGGEQIPALGIRSQRERGISSVQAHRWKLGVHDVDLRQIIGIGGRQPGRKHRRQHHGQQHQKARNRYLVAFEAVPEKGLAEAVPAGNRCRCHAFLPVSLTVGLTSP